MTVRRERSLASAGVAMHVVLAGTIAVGAAASAPFSWPADPFSVIGSTGDATAMAFNAGVVLAGLLALPFARWLWDRWHRAIGALYALIGVGLVIAGVFPMGTGLHDLVAVTFLGIPAMLWCAGIADWRAGDRRRAVASVVLGAVSLGVWLPYDLGLENAQIGYAAAELVVFAVLGCWTVWTVRRLTGDSGSTTH